MARFLGVEFRFKVVQFAWDRIVSYRGRPVLNLPSISANKVSLYK